MVADPAPVPRAQVGQNLRVYAGKAKAAAVENATRLIEARSNYEKVRETYGEN